MLLLLLLVNCDLMPALEAVWLLTPVPDLGHAILLALWSFYSSSLGPT